jgi:hypothetical protein
MGEQFKAWSQNMGHEVIRLPDILRAECPAMQAAA